MKAVLPILALLPSLLPTFSAAAETRPAVVELFTSQSCSSCPPADALLGELARRPDVVALGFHITYWDGAAWHDPFARQAATERQTAYDRRLTGGQVYTPQMVIDGTEDVVGSDRAAVLAALAKPRPAALAPVSFAADARAVEIGAGAPQAAAVVLLARYALSRTTRVAGGENAARTLTDTDAVEDLTTLGSWDGRAARFALDPPAAGEGIAVLVQAEGGAILGAAALPRP